MIQLLKQLAINYGIYFTKVTNLNKLNHFFSLIKPVKTEFDLIRIGSDSDAGYLIPNDLIGINTCFSPGVSQEAFFENDLSKMNIKSYMADFSVESPPINNNNFDFIKKYIGFENTPNFISLQDWIKLKENEDNEMILQMDIEGGEYNVLIDTSSETLKKFRIILIEFHNFDSLLNYKSFDLISSGIYKLLRDFHIVHIHPNNCAKTVKYKHFEIPPIIEFSFIRKDRVNNYSPQINFPHKLDKSNFPNYKDIILPKCFYL